MKITGQILRENRERKGVSISEVALATKINNRTIMAMEDGDSDKLPPKTFLRGFVRAYATYLALDVDSVLNTFYEEMGTTVPKSIPLPNQSSGSSSNTPTTQSETEMPKAGVNRAKSSSDADDAINPKTSVAATIGVVAAILVLVILIVIFKKKMESYESEAITNANKPAEASVPATGSPSSTAALPGAGSLPALGSAPVATSATNVMTTPLSSPVSTPTNTPAASATPAPTASSSPKPSATPKPTVTPKPTASPTPEPTATPTPKPTATPKPKPTPKPSASPDPNASPSPSPTPKVAGKGRPQEVLIEALGDVDIEATIDGEPAKQIHLNGDQVHTIKAQRKVILQLSNAGAVNITVNGSDKGVPGDLGKAKHLEYP